MCLTAWKQTLSICPRGSTSMLRWRLLSPLPAELDVAAQSFCLNWDKLGCLEHCSKKRLFPLCASVPTFNFYCKLTYFFFPSGEVILRFKLKVITKHSKVETEHCSLSAAAHRLRQSSIHCSASHCEQSISPCASLWSSRLAHASAVAFYGEGHAHIPSGLRESILDLFQGRKGSGPVLVKTKNEIHMEYNYEHSVTLWRKGRWNIFCVRLNI